MFRQVKEMEAGNPEADILDQIELMFAHENRTRRQIGAKLREQEIKLYFPETVCPKRLGRQKLFLIVDAKFALVIYLFSGNLFAGKGDLSPVRSTKTRIIFEFMMKFLSLKKIVFFCMLIKG